MSEPSVSQQMLTSLSNVYAAMADFSARADALVGWSLTSDLLTNGKKIRAGTDKDEIPNDLDIEGGNVSITPLVEDGTVSVTNGVFPGMSMYAVTGNMDIRHDVHNGLILRVMDAVAADFVLDENVPTPTAGIHVYHVIANFSTGVVRLSPPSGHSLLLLNGSNEVVTTTSQITLGFGFTTIVQLSADLWGVV